MFEKSTDELKNELLKENNIEHFIRKNEDEMYKVTVQEMLGTLLEKYGEKQKDIIKRSFIPAGYAYQVFEGRKNASRDKLIRLAMAFPLSVEETNRLIRAGGYIAGNDHQVPPSAPLALYRYYIEALRRAMAQAGSDL